MLDFKFLQKILPRVYSFLPYYLRPESALPPAHAFFEVTYRCNLRCDMCHFLEIIEDTETHKKYKQEMKAEDVQKVISRLPRHTLITFTGGEALMKNDFREILEFAASGHKVHIITNGTLLTEQVVEHLLRWRLRSLFGSGLLYIGVSLEGEEALHDRITTIPGSFRKTTRGLERLLRRRRELGSRYPLVHLTCVIKRANAMSLSSLYDYADRLGVNICNFVMNNPATYWHGKNYDQDQHLKIPAPPVEEISPGILREQLTSLVSKSRRYSTKLRFSPNHITLEEIIRYYSNESSYQNYRCYVGWTKVAVSAYGDVFSCPHYRLGSVDPETGRIPWRSERAREFRKRVKKEKIFPGCLGCCQSEYIGPQQDTKQTVRVQKGIQVLKPIPRKELATQPNCHG